VGYIFEQEIEQILHTVRGQTIGEDESITIRDILVSPIHPALKTYFRAEVAEILEKERVGEVRSKRFPYAHPEVMSLQHQIDLLLIHHYQFTQEEFSRILDEAVHFQFNYICRPQFTLLGYLVGDRRRVSVSEIMRKLVRCVEYEYFPELIRRYCEDRGLAEITYEEFKGLLSRIDAEVVSRHASDELAAMTRGLISFVDFGRATPHDAQNQPTLPTNAAIVFYEDKGLEEVKIRLEKERDEQERDLITLQKLKEILREVWSDSIDGERQGSLQASDANTSSVSAPMEEPENDAAEGGGQEESEPPQPVILPHVTVPSDPAPVEKSSEDASQDLQDVHDLFRKKDIKRFVKTIFKKDATAFRNALDGINEFDEWTDASHYLDEIFVAQDIDPFSKEAVEFTDRIYARFYTT
jgi:hypothetical protein